MRRKSLPVMVCIVVCILNASPSLPVRFSVTGLGLPLVIPPGENAVLSCHLAPQINAENMTIRWFKDKYQDLVHLYQGREDRLENQMAEYRSRTTLIKDGIIAGRVFLIIHNVRHSDSGLYTCFYGSRFHHDDAVMELKVAVLGSKPHIYLEDLKNGAITVVCESSGWYPEPEALWKDEDGNNISSFTEVKSMDGSLQFHVKATYIFNGHPSTFSCCIRNRMLSQWKQSTVHVTDALFQRIASCISSRLLISASFTVLGILLCSWIVYLINEQRKLSGKLSEKLGELSEELDWRRARRFAAEVTLDPDTAHQWLILSEDERSVRMGDRAQDVPNTPERFDPILAVLGRERLKSGRHYWEVEVGDKTDWVLGVCDESVRRKGETTLAHEDGYWTVWLRDGKYEALTSPHTLLNPHVCPRVVGLFLDYEACRFSVYNVDDRSLLFSFSVASLPPTLRPYFWLHFSYAWKNAGDLRILPVTGRE